MRAVVQRVSCAEVRVGGRPVAEMGAGLLALVGVARDDGEAEARAMAAKLVGLRVLPDADGRMNRSLLQTGEQLGVVSQFTLLGDTRKGRRPAFAHAAPADQAQPLVELLVEEARARGVQVVTGCFGASMQVALVNEGPITLLLDTERRF